MALEAIPIGAEQVTSGSALAGAQPLAMNVVRDTAGAIRRRPGLSVYGGGPTGAVSPDGIEALDVDAMGRLWAISSGVQKRLYRVTAGASAVQPGSVIPSTPGARAIMVHTEGLLAMVSGGAPQKYLFSTGRVSALGGSPPDGTHIIAQSGRLLINNNAFPGQVWFSGIATGGATEGHEQWTLGEGNAGFFSAEARPDPVVAVAENTNEVFVFGRGTLQVFATDPQTVYAPGSTREHGCIAPYSVIKRDQSFAWLDHRRRFVVSDGRAVEPIGDPIQLQIDRLEDVSDCYGFRLRTGFAEALVWVLPSAGLAFAYSGGGWAQWAGRAGDAYAPLNFGAAVHNQFDGNQVVATRDGLIGRFDEGANTDRGVEIKAELRSGFVSRGTETRKQCQAVFVTLRRGDADVTTAPVGWISWRDEPNGRWNRLPVSFGTAGRREAVVALRSLGIYRRRQWRWEFAGNVNLELVSMEEQYEFGGV